MKLIVCGGRDFVDYNKVFQVLNYHKTLHNIKEIVSGACDTGVITYRRPDGKPIHGADGIGELWAWINKIPVQPFPAAWEDLGKSAGPMRNSIMAAYADACAIFDGGKGTKSMYEKATMLERQIFDYRKITKPNKEQKQNE